MSATGVHTRGIKGAMLVAALLSCACPRPCLAALPPSAAADPDPEIQPAMGAAAQQPDAGGPMASVRMGGRLTYLNRRDMGDYGRSYEQGLMATIIARATAPVWQPWFGNLHGEIDYGVLRSDTRDPGGIYSVNHTANNISSENTSVNGKAQLSLLPMSRFPFEAHYEQHDSRRADNLSALDGYTSRRAGFSQNYRLSQGNFMFGWDGSTHNSDTLFNIATGAPGVEYRQIVRQLALTRSFGPEQTFSLNGRSTRNTLEQTEQLSDQRNWTAQHSFRRVTGITWENMADASRIRQRLLQPSLSYIDSDTRQTQLNSYAIWRPADDPLAMNGGVRLMTLDNRYDSTAAGGAASGMQTKNANFNLGATYDLSKNLQLTGSANVNLYSNESMQSAARYTSATEAAGINYKQDPVALGDYQYVLTGGGMISNSNGENRTEQQLQGQLGHNLNRSIGAGPASTVSTQVSQRVSTIWSTVTDSSRQLTHGALVAWNATQEATTTLLQLNASDARSWGANESVFQLLNFQATGNMATGPFSTWSAGLTVQATRQSYRLVSDPSQPDSVTVDYASRSDKTSSGTVSYQNQRVFGVERLRFVSDLRLYSQALLPTVGGPEDQERTAWENRLEYLIGRVQLRLHARLAKNGENLNRSYLFTLTREFGDI